MKEKIFRKIIKFFVYLFLCIGAVLILAALLSFNIKGDVGSPIYFQHELDTRLGGPFESSGSTSRYALTKSIVDSGSLLFDTELAKFASPDVVGIDGKYTTLFTPGVSFAAVPFYYLGKVLGFPQLGAFLSTTLFALFNIFLVFKISRKFHVSRTLAMISGLIFGFSTSALAYANSLTQHHFSVFLILLAILNASNKRSFLNNLTFGLVVGAAALVDIPNLFMLFPVGLYVLSKNLSLEKAAEKLKLKIKLSIIALIIGVLPMVGLFAWYNFETVGSYTKLAQSIGRTDIFATDDIKEINRLNNESTVKTSPPLLPFNTRAQLNGFYILLISDERGIFYYNPIIIFGIIGLLLSIKNKQNDSLAVVIISVVMVNTVLYSMFGDPWGGWSFGPRYLIPSIALLSTGIGYALSRSLRNPFSILFFTILLIYSTVVSVLGSTTTNLIPPKVEALNLAVTVPYTYFYNIQLAETGNSGLLLYNLAIKNYFNVLNYVYIYSAVIILLILSLYSSAILFTKYPKSEKSKFSFLSLWRKNK